ncbi:MAG: DJ-1/PfpI family protein [Polyangiales bacterium]
MKRDTHPRAADLTRRMLIERAAYVVSTLAAAPLLARCAQAADPAAPEAAAAEPEGAALDANPIPMPDVSDVQIGMLLFRGFTMLDLVGPLTALGRVAQVHLVSSSLDPVPSDMGYPLVPTTTYADCPKDLDVLFVPGGFTADVMGDQPALDFLVGHSHARYITSVCTGSLVLAAAGLLNGYRATTHWATRDMLGLFDVEVVDERVVIDRNRMTGGGVTAGIDFGLALVELLRDQPTAKIQQLMMEYNPAPPFAAGTPEQAGPELVAIVNDTLEQPNRLILQAAKDAIARM